MQQCLSSPEIGEHATRDAIHPNDEWVSQKTSHVLLTEWARLTLTTGSWKDVLNAATGVSIHLFYYPSCLTFVWRVVYSPKIYNLSGYMRTSRHGRPCTRRSYVF